MRTVNEVSKLTGVSIRTLHYYDSIGLLHPSQITEAGYRLYDDTDLERLQAIMLYRELEFPLKEIREILDSPGFDKNKALEQQITLLELRKEHIENLIDLARGIRMIGDKMLIMNFEAFDTKKIDEYARQAKESYGKTEAYREFTEKSKDWTPETTAEISKEFMQIFQEFGTMLSYKPESECAQAQVEKLRNYITEYFYDCTPEILNSLGQMYSGGGSMTENIDQKSGKGTAEFAAAAIAIYCGKIKNSAGLSEE